jgi:trehalose 6-phosphate phosphatase
MATAVATSNITQFLDEVHRAEKRVLLLDYDGTIAPFTASRELAFPYPKVTDLIGQIMECCKTSVALVSGRPAQEVVRLLGMDPVPEIWGSHGLERLRADGEYQLSHVDEDAVKVLQEAAAWLQSEGLSRSTEVKHGAVAVHWRDLPPDHAQEARTCAYRVLMSLAGIAGLSICEFDCGLELRARRSSKGDAVRTVLSEIGHDVPIAYLGDDVTDEYAFRALLGRGLTVLVRPTYRFTAAQAWLRPPDELVQFLRDWIRASGGDR